MTLKKLGTALSNAIAKISRASIVDRKLVKEVIRDIQRALLMADVSVNLVLQISQNIEKRVFEEEVPPGFTRRDIALKVVYEELLKLLGGEEKSAPTPPKLPYVIMLVGIQGSGKTTSAAKLAYFYSRKGYKVGLICADTYRPGALEQLQQLASQIGVPVYGDKNASVPEIVKNGLKYFLKEKRANIIIIDTAGRHKEEKSLLKEMKEIAEIAHPDEIMLVIDATMGKQAGVQAEAFHKVTPIGSIFLTKLDGAAKGGGALAAIVATGARIKFIGVGEKIDEIEPFDPPSFVNRLLGFGDLKALAEKIEKTKLRQRETMERILSGRMTLLDFKEQLKAMRSAGPLEKLLELIPGFSLKISSEELKISEEKMKKWLAALDSMTEEELLNPSIINRSRMKRIARGAGVTVKDVKDLLSAYEMTKKYMKRLSKSRLKMLKKLYFPR